MLLWAAARGRAYLPPAQGEDRQLSTTRHPSSLHQSASSRISSEVTPVSKTSTSIGWTARKWRRACPRIAKIPNCRERQFSHTERLSSVRRAPSHPSWRGRSSATARASSRCGAEVHRRSDPPPLRRPTPADAVPPPARQIGGKKLNQPFDGDGMICRLSFRDGRVHFKNQFVRTKGFVRSPAPPLIFPLPLLQDCVRWLRVPEESCLAECNTPTAPRFVEEQKAGKFIYKGAFTTGNPSGGGQSSPIALPRPPASTCARLRSPASAVATCALAFLSSPPHSNRHVLQPL